MSPTQCPLPMGIHGNSQQRPRTRTTTTGAFCALDLWEPGEELRNSEAWGLLLWRCAEL